MSIVNLQSIDRLLPETLIQGQSAVVVPKPGVFDQLMTEMLSVNDKLVSAEKLLQDFAAGKTTNIHHVMLTMEDAKLSFQLLTQVRNKLLEGYQDILRMQI